MTTSCRRRSRVTRIWNTYVFYYNTFYSVVNIIIFLSPIIGNRTRYATRIFISRSAVFIHARRFAQRVFTIGIRYTVSYYVYVVRDSYTAS